MTENQEVRTLSPSLLSGVENYEKYCNAELIDFENWKAEDPSYSNILPYLTSVRSLSIFRTITSGHADYMLLAEYIANSTTIRTLDLRCEDESNNLTDFFQIIQRNTRITKLSMQFIEISGYTLMDQILSMNYLKTLKFNSVEIQNEAATRFNNQKILPQRLHINNLLPCDISIIMNKNITRLELFKVDLKIDLFVYLLDNLSDTITYLDISNRADQRQSPNNYLSYEGLTKLDQFLSTNRTLRTIILDHVVQPEPNEYAKFGNSLKINTTLQTLSLRDCWLEDQVVLKIADALKFNKTLTRLELYDNTLETDTYRALVTSLIQNDILTRVSFGRYEQDYEYFYLVADLIEKSKSLEYIEVSYAAGDSDYSSSLDELMDALKHNTIVSTFLLQITFYGGTKIDELFSENYTLTTTSLGPPEKVQHYCARNRSHQRKLREDVVMIIHNIARDSITREKLPIEIWQQIFDFIRFPKAKSFGSAVRSIFAQWIR